jgi:Tfp pilus assembly PilM family ATPase
MENTLSVLFDHDRTYISAVKPTPVGIALERIDSVAATINVNDVHENAGEALQEFEEILKNISFDIGSATAVFPTSAAAIHQFPASADASPNEIRELLEFEIRQQMPGYKTDDFETTVYPMAAQSDGTEMMIAVSIENALVELAREVFSKAQITLSRVDVSQFAAHTAFLYNYPEHEQTTVMLVSVQKELLEISVLKGGKLAYYNVAALPSSVEIGGVCQREMQNLLAEYVPAIDAVFLFGPALTKTMLDSVQSALAVNVARLNSFRMMRSALDERARQYSARVAHVFPACIGGALPSQLEIVTTA